MSSLTRKIVALGLVLTIILAAAGAYVVGLSQGRSSQSNSENANNTADDSSQSNTQPNSTDVPTDYRTYTDSGLGFSFAYPNSWGNVSRKQYSNTQINDGQSSEVKTITYTAGPLHMTAIGQNTTLPGGDSPVTILAKGYRKQGTNYISRYLTDDNTSTLNKDYEHVNELHTADGTVLSLGNDCGNAIGCGLFATINLAKNNEYPGLGISYERKHNSTKDNPDQPVGENYEQAKNSSK